MTRRRLLLGGWIVVLALSSLLPLSAIFHGLVRMGGQAYVAAGPIERPIIALHDDIQATRGTRNVLISVLGNVELGGSSTGDVIDLGGRVYLRPGTQVNGDVLTILGSTYRGPGVAINGRLGGSVHQWSGTSPVPQRANLGSAFAESVHLGLAAGLALLLIGILLTIVFPWQVVLISSTLRTSPLKSFFAGLMALLTFAFLVVPLGLSLAGLPFALLLSGAGSLAWLFGITSLAVVIGRLVSRRQVSLVWAATAGLVLMAIGLAVPMLGALLVSVGGLMGAGALAVALLSRSRPVSPVA
ncbi:MAG: hypothetical protein ACRDFS_04135 [Chloroflexota bacterium]